MQNMSSDLLVKPDIGQRAVVHDSSNVWVARQRESFQSANNVVSLEGHRDVSPKQVSHSIRPDSGVRAERSSISRQSERHMTGDLFGTNLRYASLPSEGGRGNILSLVNFSPLAVDARKEAWLTDALSELAACPDRAVDEGLDEPSSLGLTKAETLLRQIAGHIEDQPDIYPMDEGSIAIDLRNPDVKSGVLFLIEENGSGALFYRTQKSKGRVRVDDAVDLLGEGGLLEIKRIGIR